MSKSVINVFIIIPPFLSLLSKGDILALHPSVNARTPQEQPMTAIRELTHIAVIGFTCPRVNSIYMHVFYIKVASS